MRNITHTHKGGEGTERGRDTVGKLEEGDTVRSRTALWERGGQQMKRAEIC